MTVCDRARFERTRCGGCGAFCGLSACVGETGIIGRLLSLLLLSSLKSGPALSSVTRISYSIYIYILWQKQSKKNNKSDLFISFQDQGSIRTAEPK